MQKVIVQIDWYTKAVLTIIAALLAGLLAKPYIATRPVGAHEQAALPKLELVQVSIKEINLGWNDYMPVNVRNWPSSVSPMPVEVKDMPHVSDEVYVTNLHGATLTVVDWKEKEDYREYLKKQWEK